MREFAKRENLNIAQEFIEKQSAKVPGRPIFNDLRNTQKEICDWKMWQTFWR
ncbi:MAG: hypothetical protein CO061_03850, partial [Candidatus Yonathbacteria bacterium CG_4_9_14_0_2_um_filter_47_74]